MGKQDKSFQVETPFKVHKKFVPDGRGLYYLGCSDSFGAGRSNTVFGQEVINTEEHLTRSLYVGQDTAHVEHSIPAISGNRKKFTKRNASTTNIAGRF